MQQFCAVRRLDRQPLSSKTISVDKHCPHDLSEMTPAKSPAATCGRLARTAPARMRLELTMHAAHQRIIHGKQDGPVSQTGTVCTNHVECCAACYAQQLSLPRVRFQVAGGAQIHHDASRRCRGVLGNKEQEAEALRSDSSACADASMTV